MSRRGMLPELRLTDPAGQVHDTFVRKVSGKRALTVARRPIAGHWVVEFLPRGDERAKVRVRVTLK